MAQHVQRRSWVSDGLFWGLMGALLAATMAGAIGYVFANFNGAGWIGGGALASVIFLFAGIILARSATSTTLPPPNTLKAPTAPPGGAFRAPAGGAYRMPGARVTQSAPRPSQPASEPQSMAEMGHSAGEAVGKAAYSASAAVTGAAQAAKAAIADAMGSSSSGPAARDRAEDRAEDRAATVSGAPAPVARGGAPTAAAPVPDNAVKPATLDAPREGGADNLKRIRGVGPKLEDMLHSLGFYHFDQIAAWTPEELAWVDSHLEGFNGRATRDEWAPQAKALAAGEETEFSRRVDEGDVY